MSDASAKNAPEVPGLAAPPLVKLVCDCGVAELALANPPLNLVTKQLLEQLHDALLLIARDESVRALIVHQGSSRAFCAGSDMREFEAVKERAADNKILFEEFVIRQLAQIHCPSIAAIDGPALGGGFELALACDIRIGAPRASVGLTECLIGGLGGSGAVRITRLVGPARASELLFTGKVLNAADACDWGLLNEVADETSALDRARALASIIASRGPLSNRYAKRLISAAQDSPIASALSLANEFQERIFQSDDLMSGARSFFDKVPPRFRGQ